PTPDRAGLFLVERPCLTASGGLAGKRRQLTAPGDFGLEHRWFRRARLATCPGMGASSAATRAVGWTRPFPGISVEGFPAVVSGLRGIVRERAETAVPSSAREACRARRSAGSQRRDAVAVEWRAWSWRCQTRAATSGAAPSGGVTRSAPAADRRDWKKPGASR